jgi:hypothetical protein
MVPNVYDKNIAQIISPMNRNKMTKKQTSSSSVSNNSAFYSNFKLKTSITGRRNSHPDACTSVEHAHPSYIYIHLGYTRYFRSHTN